MTETGEQIAERIVVKSDFFKTPIYTEWIKEQEEFLREQLKGKTVKAGETTEIHVLGHKIPLEIISTSPQNVRVKVTDKTRIVIAQETALEKEKMQKVQQSLPIPVKIGKNYRITIPKEWVELLQLQVGEIIWLIIKKEL